MRQFSDIKECFMVMLISALFLAIVFVITNFITNFIKTGDFRAIEFTETAEYQKQKQAYLKSL